MTQAQLQSDRFKIYPWLRTVHQKEDALRSQTKRICGYLFPSATTQLGRIYRALKRPATPARRNIARAAAIRQQFGEFTSDALCHFLRDWGVNSGDTLMVHSSMDAMPHLVSQPLELIGSLRAIIGPQGTLCMPTFPNVGPAYPNRVFDVRRTPSTTGLLTEFFRRCPGVLRSMQLRSVSAVGPLAAWLVADHHRSPYTCGVLSPYYRVAEANGKIVVIGLTPEYASVFHCAEDILEHRFPTAIYEDEPYVFESRCADGKAHVVQACQLKVRYDYVSDGMRMLPYFSDTIVCVRSFHGVPCALIDARGLVGRLVDLAQCGVHMYGFRFPRTVPAATVPAKRKAG